MNLLHANTEGNGPDLIVLHGFLGMSDNWKTLGRQLASSGLLVHLVDQRNHGRSFWSDRFSYALMTEDVVRYMDAKGVGNALVLGHSMGGKTAMTLACAYPERVSKLLVADIAPKYYPPHHKYILDALESLPVAALKSRSEADTLLAESLKDWGIRQFLLKNLYWVKPGQLGFRFNLEVLKESMEAIGAALPPNARFEGETLFLRGGKSPYIGDEDWPEIQSHFPLARLETLEGAGHWLHAEAPEAFLEKVLDFIKS
ncbi:alpha/beta fold hydrolase [Robiginitalea sediminis]|uniref:alpha/beta fold hydrolase n=1 Tax=Robiginitalea sediminis TaxID=1982593 RepID=UPI000B4AB82B|nr:alpha/beta fold hydrolase [Robiginitalea sediminis]